jgi:hypothetical protein
MELLKKGLNYKGLVISLIFFTSGSILLILSINVLKELKISGFVIEQKYLFIIASGFIGISIISFLSNLNQIKCVECNTVLKTEDLFFKLSNEEQLMGLILDEDTQYLRLLSSANKEDLRLTINFKYCDKCENAGEISLIRHDNTGTLVLHKPKVISGSLVSSIIVLVKEQIKNRKIEAKKLF